MTTLVAERPVMSAKKNTPVRLADSAIALARIASGYTGESVAEYVSRVIAEQAQKDIERLHTEKFPGGKPRR
jgi:hypothetical protein